MAKKLSEIISALPKADVTGKESQTIEAVVFDSRKATAKTLFVAQKGAANDGHDYIAKVVEQGCRAIVCEHAPEGLPTDCCVIKVENSHEALGLVASAFYDHPSKKLRLVGVTGTNGKTTIATLLYRLVKRMGHKAGLLSTIANYVDDEKHETKNTTSDALTINSLMREMVDRGCEYCFMEVSSHSIVQSRIAGLDFDGGIFTNLTHDHLDYHKTFEAYINAKKAFFDQLPAKAFALTNLDDRNGQKMLQNTKAKKMTYSLRSMADFKGEVVESSFEGMQMRINGREAFMQLVGRFNASNLLAIYGAAVGLGLEPDDILVNMSALQSADGRFQTIRSKDGVTAIVDYAHTPDALLNVIGTINDIRRPEHRLICVVGCGGDRDKTKRPEMAHEAARACTNVILTSDNPRSEDPEDILNDMKAGLEGDEARHTLTVADRREAIRIALTLAQEGDVVLIAGKGHENYQEVKGVRHHFDDCEEVRKMFGITQ